MHALTIHTDGGARGNPGPAAVGVVIRLGETTVLSFGKRIGETTNNVAEYRGVIEAFHAIASHSEFTEITHLNFFLDSALVVSQLNGIFRVKDPKMRMLLLEVRSLEQQSGKIARYTHVRREQNRDADLLVNQALDA